MVAVLRGVGVLTIWFGVWGMGAFAPSVTNWRSSSGAASFFEACLHLQGFRAWDSGFGGQAVGFRVLGSEFGVQGLGFRV